MKPAITGLPGPWLYIAGQAARRLASAP